MVIYNTCPAQDTIPLKIKNGHIFLSAKINGIEINDIELDTGAGIDVLSESTVNKLGGIDHLILDGYEVGFRATGQRLEAPRYKINEIQIGNKKQQIAYTGVWNGLDEDKIGGLLSLTFFMDKPFTVDYKNQKLIFETSRSLKNIHSRAVLIPILLHQSTKRASMFVNMCVNDSISLETEFDTGSGFDNLWIHPHYKKSLNIDTSSNFGIVRKIQMYCTDTSAVLNNWRVKFPPNMIYEGLSGAGPFMDKKMTIDLQHQVMYKWE